MNQIKISSKLFSLLFSVLITCFVVGFYVLAWQEPTAPAPGNNVSLPLNVSSLGQTKVGGLILNTGGATIGLIVDKGNVGIGTTVPGSKLVVYGAATYEQRLTGNSLTFTRTDGDSYIEQIGTGKIRFRMGSSYTDVMAIQQNGNVGVGTMTPHTKAVGSGFLDTQDVWLRDAKGGAGAWASQGGVGRTYVNRISYLDHQEGQVNCDSGDIATGGGYYQPENNDDFAVYPTVNGAMAGDHSVPNGWHCRSEKSGVCFVVCLDVS